MPQNPELDPVDADDRVDPVDPDVDLRDPAQRTETRWWDILLAIALGGVIGAEARYFLAGAWPHAAAAFPWSTLVINIVGSAVLGGLVAVIDRLARAPRLLRPFVGVGVCGGFTTFSTFAVDAYKLLLADRPGIALGYLAASVIACAAGVLLGMALIGGMTRGGGRR